MSQRHEESDYGPVIGAPRWVKVFGAIAIALIVLFIVLHLTGLTPSGHGG